MDVVQELNISNEDIKSQLKIDKNLKSHIKTGKQNVSLDKIYALCEAYEEVNVDYIITGKGKMLKEDSTKDEISQTPTKGSIPYFENLPVSAGRSEMIETKESPTGWIDLPGIYAKWLFPVVGFSMQPEINSGDTVGVVPVDKWDMVDPDKTYLIVTNDDRMIKHLAIDEKDDEILWCISPNYPKFPIRKEDIKAVYRVTFHGRIL